MRVTFDTRIESGGNRRKQSWNSTRTIYIKNWIVHQSDIRYPIPAYNECRIIRCE
jgi:hypothetical protein